MHLVCTRSEPFESLLALGYALRKLFGFQSRFETLFQAAAEFRFQRLNYVRHLWLLVWVHLYKLTVDATHLGDQ
jgi:hypothetical protein